MKRTLMQVYVKGSVEAVRFYQKAFDAQLVVAYTNDDGTYGHAELDVDGQILAIAEDDAVLSTGNTMQFCLHFEHDEKDKVTKAYDVLTQGAVKLFGPLGPCPFSPHQASLVDKYGVSCAFFLTDAM